MRAVLRKMGARTFVVLFLSITVILHSLVVFESDHLRSAALKGDGYYPEEGFGVSPALERNTTTRTIVIGSTQTLRQSTSSKESEEEETVSPDTEEEDISAIEFEEDYNSSSTLEPEPLEPCTVPQYTKSNSTTKRGEDDSASSCAILFFGLPRSYKLFVLPSIIENIILPNMENNCDYYVHYHTVASEEGIRSNETGGAIHGTDVFLLEEAIRQTYQREATEGAPINLPHVSVTNSTIEEFETARNETLRRFEATLDEDGEYLYFPVESFSWKYPDTMRNMIKQWHSIDAVWRHMEQTASRLQKTYSRVMMLRNDVVYVTPIDAYQLSSQRRDTENNHIVIPDWANHPVNDRMVAGPYEAVKVWATERFQRAEDHIRNYPIPGWGLHSERFLNFTIIPAMMDERSYALDPNPDVCFLRARADGSVWLEDCDESFWCDMDPVVRRILGKHHVMANSTGNVGVVCEIEYLDGIKIQDILVCWETENEGGQAEQ